jgi:ElaB/YqjD/DUF883 family membrane-anchored ribosome-binding protein
MTSYQEGLSSSRDYAREAEHTRRRLAENLDELSDRLTPGQVFDEMLTYSRAGSGTFLSAFSNAVRQNPLPSLLIGAGCMMFLSEKMGVRPGLGNGGPPRTSAADDPYGVSSRVGEAAGGVSDAASRMAGRAASSAEAAAGSVRSGLANAAETTQRRASEMTGGIADAARQTAMAAGDTAAGAVDALRGAAHDARDAASYGVEQMRRTAQAAGGAMRDSAASMGHAAAETIGDTAASVRDAAASVGGRMADTVDRTRRQGADMVRQGRDSAASFISDQPLLCAAIGVAIGAALASMLPSTEVEDKLMGEKSDAVKDAAHRTGASALEGAKNVAGKVVERTQTAVAEEGLSASGLAEAARNTVDGAEKDERGILDKPATGTGPQEGTSGSSDS